MSALDFLKQTGRALPIQGLLLSFGDDSDCTLFWARLSFPTGLFLIASAFGPRFGVNLRSDCLHLYSVYLNEEY